MALEDDADAMTELIITLLLALLITFGRGPTTAVDCCGGVGGVGKGTAEEDVDRSGLVAVVVVVVIVPVEVS